MNPSDEQRDPLDDAYRQASAAEAGRPSAVTRQAIMAEAAAAARRRVPAANDSRYLWRGVAGVAVLGFAILLWQQVDHGMPGTQPLAAAPQAQQLERVQEAMPAPPPMPAQTREAESAVRSRPAPANVEQKAALPQAPPVVMGVAADAAGNTAEIAQAPAPSRAAAKMSAEQDAKSDPDALLRLNFPAQYDSDKGHSLWLVQDATGNVLRRGELPPGNTLAELRSEIERELGGKLLRPWRIHSLQNARGQSIQLAVAQTS